MPEGLDVGDVSTSLYPSDFDNLTDFLGDEHARALEEQWIEGGLTADTATSTSLFPSSLSYLACNDMLTDSDNRRNVFIHNARSPNRFLTPSTPRSILARTSPTDFFRCRRRGSFGGNGLGRYECIGHGWDG